MTLNTEKNGKIFRFLTFYAMIKGRGYTGLLKKKLAGEFGSCSRFPNPPLGRVIQRTAPKCLHAGIGDAGEFIYYTTLEMKTFVTVCTSKSLAYLDGNR